MSTQTPVRLKERGTGELCDAVLLDGLGKEEIEAAEGVWRPFLKAELARLDAEGVSKAKWPQHRGWDWREKQKAIDGLLAYRIFGIACASQMQGLMLVATAGQSARIESQRGRPLITLLGHRTMEFPTGCCGAKIFARWKRADGGRYSIEP